MNTEIAKPFLASLSSPPATEREPTAQIGAEILPFPPSPGALPVTGREIAEQVGAEILHRDFDPAAWAKALAAARNRNTDPTGEYARIRIAELARERRRCRAKAESLEIRRLQIRTGVKSVKDLLLQGGSNRKQPNIDRPVLSVACLISLFLGSAGSIGCGIRLLAGTPSAVWTPVVSLICAGFIVGVVFLLWKFLPRRWLQMGYHLGLGSLTAAACLLSFVLGARLLTQSPQHWRLVNNRIVPVSCGVTGSGDSDTSVSAAADSAPAALETALNEDR